MISSPAPTLCFAKRSCGGPYPAAGSVQLSYLVNRTPGHGSPATFYPSFALRVLSCLERRDFFRAAVFSCIVLVAAVSSSFFTTSRYCSLAASTSPLLKAVSKCLICVFTWLLRARLTALLLAFCLTLFFADNECATIISYNLIFRLPNNLISIRSLTVARPEALERAALSSIIPRLSSVLCLLGSSQLIYPLVDILEGKIKLSNFAKNLQRLFVLTLLFVRAGKIVPQFLGDTIILYLV